MRVWKGAGLPAPQQVPVELIRVRIRKILTRTGGFLRAVTSHSLQPYAGCSFGNSLCGAGCYAQHYAYLTRGRAWGSFLEVRENAASSYLEGVSAERRWARRARGRFSVFMSSVTDPFVPQERTLGVTRQVLEAMCEEPPDLLVVQTRSPAVTDYLDLYPELNRRCPLRFHLSIESDRQRLPGLPPGLSVEKRFAAARRLKEAGLQVVITVSPLLPIADPERFFARVAECAHAVVLDHFIGGDGTPDGRRTRLTPVPEAMRRVDPASVGLDYLDRMARVARRYLPGRVGLRAKGFAGCYGGEGELR